MFKKNNFSFKIFYVILILLIKLDIIFSYITLPIYTLDKKNILSQYSPNSIQDLIFAEYISPFYTVIEIGSPPQKIPLLIEMKTNDFVITSMYKIEGNPFYSNKTLYNFNEIYGKYNFFNEKNSYSFNSNSCKKREIYYNYEEYENAVCEETCPAKDVFYLYKNLDMKNKIKISDANFDLVKNIKDNVTGVLGLHLLENKRTQRSFLNFLKMNNLTDNYNFFFEFNSPKDKTGKLIIGSFLDELYQNNYKRDDLCYSTAIKGFYFYNVRFNKIYVENNTNDTLIYNLENKDAELDFKHDVIIADFDYKKIFSNYIQDLLDEKRCFFSDFIGSEGFYESNHENVSFFYCNNTGNITSELKKRILPIKLFANEFNNYTFEILSEDILLAKGDYILIKIVFPTYNYKWVLGKPFSLKYKFIFNPQIKQIGFYVQSGDRKEKTGNNFLKYFLYTIIIIVLIAVFVVVGIILGKKIYGLKRKKRANEMEDDYEYFEGKIKVDNENEEKKEGKNYDVIN